MSLLPIDVKRFIIQFKICMHFQIIDQSIQHIHDIAVCPNPQQKKKLNHEVVCTMLDWLMQISICEIKKSEVNG